MYTFCSFRYSIKTNKISISSNNSRKWSAASKACSSVAVYFGCQINVHLTNACTLVPTVFRWHGKMAFKFHFHFRFSFSHHFETLIWVSFFVFTSLFNEESYMTNNMMIAAKKHIDCGAAIATLAYPRWGRKMTNIWRLYNLKSQNARWFSKTKVILTGTHQRLALVDSFIVRAGDTVP